MSLNVKLTYLHSYPTNLIDLLLSISTDREIRFLDSKKDITNVGVDKFKTNINNGINSDIEDYTNPVLFSVILGLIPSWPPDGFWRNHSSTKLV